MVLVSAAAPCCAGAYEFWCSLERAHALVFDILDCTGLWSRLKDSLAIRAAYLPHREQPFKRELWLRHGRRDSRPILGSSALSRAYRQKMHLRAMCVPTPVWREPTHRPQPPPPGRRWVRSLSLRRHRTWGAGLRPGGGRATAVAVDPADGTGNTVYIGGAYGGVWKSSNAGALERESLRLLGLRSPTINPLWP